MQNIKDIKSSTNRIKADPQQWACKHKTYLYSFANKRVGDKEKSNDLVQDTFLAGLENLEQFNGNSSERTWLTSILLHKIFDHYRKRSIEITRHPLVLNAQIDQQSGTSLENNLNYKQFIDTVESNLLKMPHLWASVFKMKYLHGESAENICLCLGITSTNYWTITHRSKLRMRNYLQKAC